METEMVSLVLIEIAAGIILGFAVWSFVAPKLVNVQPITA